MRKIFFGGVMVFIGAAIACSNQDRQLTVDSNVKIVGGKAARTQDYPSVIKMIVDPGSSTSAAKICTGVIVSHRTVLAAAHCIKQNPSAKNNVYHFVEVEGGSTRTSEPAKATYVVTYNEPLSQDTIPESHVAVDLAVIDFGQNTFNLAVYPKVASQKPISQEAVNLVGFGATSFDTGKAQTGSLNSGKNQLSSVEPGSGLLKIEGSLDSEGLVTSGALAALGDSGGPLFNAQGELIGIGSALSIEGQAVTNYFVDLSSRESQTLIGRYLQEFGGGSSSLIPGFTAAMGADFARIKARSPGAGKMLTAMCGKSKGEGNEKGGGQVNSNPKDDNLGSIFGTGVGDQNATASPTQADSSTDSSDSVVNEVGQGGSLDSGMTVVTP